MNFEEFTTEELVGELKKRVGVKVITVDPYEKYLIAGEGYKIDNTGPTVILEVID